jgi:hypothetical protein
MKKEISEKIYRIHEVEKFIKNEVNRQKYDNWEIFAAIDIVAFFEKCEKIVNKDTASEHFRKQRDETLIELHEIIQRYNKDLCEFAEWCSKNGWIYIDGSDIWGNNVDRWEEKTTSQLRDQWEIETGRRNSNDT